MPLAISAPVGRRGTNATADVSAVQAALQTAAAVMADARLHPGPVDGRAGDGTVGAVLWLQRAYCHTRTPDGRIDPGAFTLATLAALCRMAHAGWTFPLEKSATAPYVGAGAGMRAFRASRSGGRAHAGCDLYRPVGTPVYAVAPGRVLSTAPFYLKTNAVEVEHVGRTPDGEEFRYTCRYGEVDPRVAVRVGETVRAGQVLGTIGQMIYSNGRRFNGAMVHFELYLGTVPGALTDRSTRGAWDRVAGGPFVRRRDLCDPSALLRAAPLPGKASLPSPAGCS